MSYRSLLLVAIIALLTSLGGCTNETTEPPPPIEPAPTLLSESGLDPQLRIVDLSEPQMLQLCEWSVDFQGGVGRQVSCPTFTHQVGTVNGCQAARVARLPTCGYTVANMEACVVALTDDACSALSSGSACESPPDCFADGADPIRGSITP